LGALPSDSLHLGIWGGLAEQILEIRLDGRSGRGNAQKTG